MVNDMKKSQILKLVRAKIVEDIATYGEHPYNVSPYICDNLNELVDERKISYNESSTIKTWIRESLGDRFCVGQWLFDHGFLPDCAYTADGADGRLFNRTHRYWCDNQIEYRLLWLDNMIEYWEFQGE